MLVNGKEKKLLVSEKRHRFTSQKYSVAIATFTANECQELLKHFNGRNRPPTRAEVEQIKTDILAGQWVGETGNVVSFYHDGNIASGQHRLMAFAELERPFMVAVVYGLPDTATPHVDKGRKRSAPLSIALATLQEKGIVSANSTEIKTLIRSIKPEVSAARSFLKFGNINRNPSTSALVTCLQEHAPAFGYAFKAAPGFRPGFVAAVAKSYEQDQTSAVEFTTLTVGNAPLSVEHPIEILRNEFKRSATGGNSGRDDFQNTVKAFESFRQRPVRT